MSNESAEFNTTLSRSQVEMISLSVSLAIIIALSLCGNFLLILAFIRNNRLRSSFANKLIMSLAVADFLTAALPLTYQLCTVIDVHLISNEGLLCTIGGLTSYSFFFTSVFTLVMLSIDRFMALGFPLRYNRYINIKVQVFMIAYPWAHGLLFLIVAGTLLKIRYNPESFDCSLSWSNRPLWFTLTVLLIHIILPLCLLVVVNTWTQILVRAHNRRIMREVQKVGTVGSLRDRQQQVIHRRAAIECRLARVSTVIIFVFLGCWTPYVVTRTLAFIGLGLSSGVKSAAAWCVHASSFVNPIIYSSLRADLRKELLGVFKICRTTRVVAYNNDGVRLDGICDTLGSFNRDKGTP